MLYAIYEYMRERGVFVLMLYNAEKYICIIEYATDCTEYRLLYLTSWPTRPSHADRPTNNMLLFNLFFCRI